MWCNGGVADDVEPLALGGDDSPWAHDLPIAEPAPLPPGWTESERSVPVEPTGRHDVAPAADESSAPLRPPAFAPPDAMPAVTGAPTPEHRHRRTVLVVGLVGLLAAAVIGSQLVGRDGGGTADDADSAPGVSSATSDSDTTDATSGPTTTSRPRLRPTTTFGDRLPEPEPEWVAATIELDPRLAAFTTPTELVALGSDGTLHIINTATATMRSIDTDRSGLEAMMAVGAHDILLTSYSHNDVTAARVDEPLVRLDVDGGLTLVKARPGTDEFVFVPNNWDPSSPEVLELGSDRQLTRVTTGPLVQFNPWEIQFLPATGQLIVNQTGGVYVLDDAGAAVRISTGELVIVGAHHYILRECDEVLACAYVRVDQSTGQRDVIDLSTLDRYLQWGDLTSASLAPDGGAVSYFDWMNGASAPVRRLIDLSTGTNIELGTSDIYTNEPAWTVDSSGLFLVSGRTLSFYDRATATVFPVVRSAGLDDIVAVAARPLTS